MNNKRSSSYRGLLAAALAMLFQATWAAYANHAHGLQPSLRAAIVQGIASFVMTFLITLVIERLLAMFNMCSAFWQLLWTFICSTLVMLIMQIGVHLLANTPEILLTVLLPALIGSGYCFFYTLGRVYFGKVRKTSTQRILL